jgi:hypothetical protein
MSRLRNESSSEPLLHEDSAVAPVELLPLSRQPQHGPAHHGTTYITAHGQGSPFVNLPECDFVSFLAIVQSLHIPFFDFEPDTSDSVRMGSRTHVIHLRGNKGIVFKSEPDLPETLANQVLVSEILVLGHPVLSKHPNIQGLLGVAWQPKFFKDKFLRVVPHLVFEKSHHGSLWEFTVERHRKGEDLSFIDRLHLCSNIGDAVEAMHEFSRLANLLTLTMRG